MKDKKSPLVSVIVPSYNHEKYIEETIESIVNQTYKNIELIVIDDGSKDNSVQILEELSKKYNFNLITQENKGLSRTLNKGIKLSKGKYICLCASDDILVLNKLEIQVNFMENNPQYAIVYGKKINFYQNGLKRHINNKNFRSGNIFNDLFLQKFSIPAVSIMYKKIIFEEVGGFDTDLAVEDFDMALRIAKKYEIGYIDEYFYYYRVHDSNTINDTDKMKYNVKKTLEKWKDDENYQNAVIQNSLLYFKYYASLHKIKSLKELPISFKLLNNRIFYEGMIRLLIPKILYKAIKK